MCVCVCGGGGGGAFKYKTRNEGQSFMYDKCIEEFELTLYNHLMHPFIIARIYFYLR